MQDELKNVRIVHECRREEFQRYLDEGYCVVAAWPSHATCCVNLQGGCQDILQTPALAVRAYSRCFGVRGNDQRFVTFGPQRFDVAFCIGSLAGVLPHPSRAGEHKDSRQTCDLTRLALLVDYVQLDPSALISLEAGHERVLSAWKEIIGKVCSDEPASYTDVRTLCTLLGSAE
jgi:hypothetical protein